MKEFNSKMGVLVTVVIVLEVLAYLYIKEPVNLGLVVSLTCGGLTPIAYLYSLKPVQRWKG